MSLSTPDNTFPKSASGKTPPPAPSAAFAKRARELQAEGAMGARYRPPALRAMASSGSPSNDVSPASTPQIDGSSLPPNNLPAGFRRARAGTLPSNVSLAAQRLAASSPGLAGSNDSFIDTYSQLQPQQRQQPSVLPTTATLPTATRPTLRHATSVASSVATSAVTERNSRLRSGSLTLPAGLSNPFASAIFSTSWLSNNKSTSNFQVLDELRSATSLDSAGGDEVHTLDYLGLDENTRHPPAATISELRNQAQAAIAGNLANPSRVRASTVSNPYRMRSAGASSTLLPTTNAEEDEELLEEYDSHGQLYSQADSYDNPYNSSGYYSNSYSTKNLMQGQGLTANGIGVRPRAISIGNLDDATRLSQRYLASVSNEHDVYGSDLGSLTNSSVTRLSGSRTNSGQGVRFSPAENTSNRATPYLVAPATQSRAISPKSEVSSTQIQTPTRSLWIGNLDSTVTSEQLIHVFAPYGAIESLRLLPEKECGFVNFVDQADAIRAKDDVLNRLGGQIGMPSGQAVRIGFGKADSAPVAPAKGTTITVPPGNGAGGINKSTSQGGLNGMESQLQSTPTRALWIGSIPSTTTPSTILSVFSPFGPIESARVLTHKNCGFINFERLDDAVRARKALNGRDVLGSDVGAIRIGFAKVPVKNLDGSTQEEGAGMNVQGIGEMSVGATIHALRSVKGASTVPAEQQVLSGAVENYRSNLLLSMIGSGVHNTTTVNDATGKPTSWLSSTTEQQMIVRELSEGSPDAEADIQALAEFRPPTTYYTTIPLVADRPNNKRWDASKLRELRKRLDSGTMTTEDVDSVAADFLDGEIVDLASDWLGNTVVQKLFEKCSQTPRFVMLERIAPHLAMIGIHKNGTWAAQKIIECVQTPEEITHVAQNLRPYAPPLLLDQFGNYVIQCCLRFGAPANDFIFEAMADRLWEIAQGRFGARSMRACLESPHVTVSQQRRIATAVILNSIPLATNPNGALLLTWLLDTSGFPARYRLLAPRFTPHLSHLCTHKLASLTVLRIVNQKVEPIASTQIVQALFFSLGDHVLTDVLGDQVNGVAVVHKILTSPFIDQAEKPRYLEATKRALIELKVIATQAYRRLIEEVGLPVPNYQSSSYNAAVPPTNKQKANQNSYGMPGLPPNYAGASNDQNLASMMAALQMGGQSHMTPPQGVAPTLQIDPNYNQSNGRGRGPNPGSTYTPNSDPFNPFSVPQVDGSPRNGNRGNGSAQGPMSSSPNLHSVPFNPQTPILGQPGSVMGMGQAPYGMQPQSMPGPVYQAYMYQMYQQQNSANIGAFHS